MSKRSRLLVAAASSIALTLSGCANSPIAFQVDRASAKAVAEAPVRTERQPDICNEGFEKLPESQIVGVEARTVIKRYEKLIEGPVNDRIHGCYAFNETLLKGLTSPKP